MKRIILVLFLVLTLAACSNDGTNETTNPTTMENQQGSVEEIAKETTKEATKPNPKDDLDFAKKVITWFEDSGLPIYNVRDTTSNDKDLYIGLTASVSSNAVNVLLFDNEENAEKRKSEEFFILKNGRVLLSIKDEANADNYVRVLSEQKAIPDLKLNYLSTEAEKFITNLPNFKSYQEFTSQFLQFEQPIRTSIYQTYLYTREFEWEGIVLDRDTVGDGLILWCGDVNNIPKHWLDSTGKIETLSDIVVIKLKDDDVKAYIDAGDKVKFKGKMNRIWNKEWNRNWEFIDAEIIK